jgi:hypothetical protein
LVVEERSEWCFPALAQGAGIALTALVNHRVVFGLGVPALVLGGEVEEGTCFFRRLQATASRNE